MRDNFSAKTIDTLAKRVAYLCSNPDCRAHTVGANELSSKSTLIGVAAHITAASAGGARFNESLTQEQRSSISNGIWLCSNCSTLIDKDPAKFTVELLNDWKNVAEKESSERLQKRPSARKIIQKGVPVKSIKSIKERALENNKQREKELEVKAFLRSSAAIEVAREQVRILIEKLKEVRTTIDDPSSGFNIAFEARRDEMYAIGRERRYLCFNWCRPQEWDINVAMLKVILYTVEGVWEFDRRDIPQEAKDYKYYRNKDGVDGWVDFETGGNFISTDDLSDLWIEKFFQFIGYS